MDLLYLTQKDTGECVIKDPFTGEDTDLVITVHGPGTEQYKTAIKLIMAKEGEAKDAEALATATVGWSNFESNGEPFEFTKENATMAYQASIPLRLQVSDFLFGIRNFLPKRALTSPSLPVS